MLARLCFISELRGGIKKGIDGCTSGRTEDADLNSA